MFRHKSLALILIVTVSAMSLFPGQAEAKKPWWQIVGGLLATGGAVAAGLTGAGAAVVVPLCGVETALLGIAAGGGSDNGGGIPGGINDAPPYYAGPIQPDFCGGAQTCGAMEAILQARLRPLPLPGTTTAEDNLTRAVNELMANTLKDLLVSGADLPAVQTEMLAMAAQLDSVIFWYTAVEDETPGFRLEFTNQMVAQARDAIATNGLPAEEVAIFSDAGLSPDQIAEITAFHVEAMGDIELIVEPLTVQDILQEAANSLRSMGSAVAAAGDPIPQVGLSVNQNAPNPFNPSTVIEYAVTESGPLTIQIYDARGSLIRTLVDEHVASGPGQVTWHGENDRGASVPSGLYFCKVRGAGQDRIIKMTMLK